MNELCGMDCCSKCSLRGSRCDGCRETDGHPCGGSCTAAECIRAGGMAAMAAQKQSIIDEVNGLGMKDLRVDNLYLLNGAFVNLAYPLPCGQQVRMLDDQRTYWGSQVERPDCGRCYGIIADGTFLIVCEYGCDGTDPELLLFRKRG